MACLAVSVPSSSEGWGQSPSENSAWYAIHTYPKQEFKVQTGLSRLEVEHYLPTCCALSWYDQFRHKLAKSREIQRPLFPGYLFFRAFEGDSLYAIKDLSGVGFIVSSGCRPVPVSNEEIETIRILESSGLLIEDHPFTVGQDVIVGGPLKGAYGKIEQIGIDLYLVVSVEMMRRSVRVKVERDWVKAA
jgi:transcription termination/antitermination protein NusG